MRYLHKLLLLAFTINCPSKTRQISESLIRHQEFRRELALPRESRPVPDSIQNSAASSSQRYLDIINWKPVRMTEEQARLGTSSKICLFLFNKNMLKFWAPNLLIRHKSNYSGFSHLGTPCSCQLSFSQKLLKCSESRSA